MRQITHWLAIEIKGWSENSQMTHKSERPIAAISSTLFGMKAVLQSSAGQQPAQCAGKPPLRNSE